MSIHVYRELLLERFAKRVEEAMLDEKMWVKIDEIGKLLILNPEDSRAYAAFLEEEGWAKTRGADGDSPEIRLTLKGLREVEKFRWPWWERWLDKHPFFLGSVVASAFWFTLDLLKAWLAR